MNFYIFCYVILLQYSLAIFVNDVNGNVLFFGNWNECYQKIVWDGKVRMTNSEFQQRKDEMREVCHPIQLSCITNISLDVKHTPIWHKRNHYHKINQSVCFSPLADKIFRNLFTGKKLNRMPKICLCSKGNTVNL